MRIVLWFYFDTSLEESREGEEWFGELHLETIDPDGLSMEESYNDHLTLFLKKETRGGESEIIDSVTIPVRNLNPLTVLCAVKQAKVVLPSKPPVVISNQDIYELWQEFFSAVDGFFSDPEDPQNKDFEGIMRDLLDQKVKREAMKVLKGHLAKRRKK